MLTVVFRSPLKKPNSYEYYQSCEISIMLFVKSPFFPSLYLALLLLENPRIGQVQYRIDNSRNRICRKVSRLVFLFRVLLFCNLFVVFQYRIQFIESICRELLAQHRPVGNNACVVVDKRYAIDSAHGIGADTTSIPSAFNNRRNSSRVLHGLMASLTVCRSRSSVPSSFSFIFEFS